MNWKLKAKIQNIVSLLPESLSHEIYYYMQRGFGGLGSPNPIRRLTAGIETCKMIEKIGRAPVDGVFFEIGTGRRINVPLAFWLCGAAKIVTVDLNPYLKKDLIEADLNFIGENRDEIEKLFGGMIYSARLTDLISFSAGKWELKDLLNFCSIEYFAPADASDLNLKRESIDYYTSFTVLEHIPPEKIISIFYEGNRILKKDGIHLHRVDYSDHFSHSDRSISSINFLRFDDKKWEKLAGNRYMYMNRLRVDDFLELIESTGQKIILIESDMDAEALDLLRNGQFKVDSRFSNKPLEYLATSKSWIITKRKNDAENE